MISTSISIYKRFKNKFRIFLLQIFLGTLKKEKKRIERDFFWGKYLDTKQEIHSKIVVNTLCKEKLASSLPMPLSARKYYLLLLRTLLVVYNLGKINVEFVFALGFAQILT